MKNILAVILSAAMLAVSIPTAQADNSEEVIIGILGGALGGFVLGSAINGAPRERVYVRREYIYNEPVYEPEYVERCYVKKVRVFDYRTNTYVRVKRTFCE